MTVDKIGDSLPPSGSEISIKDLIDLVNGAAVKDIPKSVSNLTNRGEKPKTYIRQKRDRIKNDRAKNSARY